MLPRALAWSLIALFGVSGCYEVLTHQDESTDVFMDWDGEVSVTPSSLELSAVPGEQATAELSFSEVSARAAVELELELQGDAVDQLAIQPGEWSVVVVPSGTLLVTVTFSPPDGATNSTAEIVATTSGSPTELRIPITTDTSPGSPSP